MKNIYIILILFLILGGCFTSHLNAQTKNALVGEWVVVARKGNGFCAKDITLKFIDDGTASIIHGLKYENCEKRTATYASWGTGRHSRMTDTGWDKFDAIKFINEEEKVVNSYEVLTFVGDFMKIRYERRKNGERSFHTLIFKKL